MKIDNNLLKNKIFIKLKAPQGDAPKDAKDFKEWRNAQKAPGQKSWRNKEDWFTYTELVNSPNIAMIVPEGFVVVDIDNKEISEKVLKYVDKENISCIVSKTGNGAHLMFKKGEYDIPQTSNLLTYGGIAVDFKVGGKNGYIAIKFFPDVEITGDPNGFRLQNFTTSLDDIDEIPQVLLPLENQYFKDIEKIKFNKWKKNTRDEDMTAYSKILYSNDIRTKKKMNKILWFINIYIMDEPLWRQEHSMGSKVSKWIEWCKKEFKETRKPAGRRTGEFGLAEVRIDYIELAKNLMDKIHIKYYEENFYIKTEQQWYNVAREENIYLAFLKDKGNDGFSANEKHLINALKVKAIRKETDEKDNLINTKNGRFCLNTNELIPYTGEEFLIRGIDINYNPLAERDVIDEGLETWTQGHQDEIDIIWRFMGSILYRVNKKSKLLLLYGKSANNGKSTLMDFIRYWISPFKTTALNISQIESKHGLSNIIGKDLIQIDELEDGYLSKANNLKALITGGAVEIEPKFKNTRTIIPTQKVIAACNNFPRVQDQSNGFWRRILILPFEWKVEDGGNPNWNDKKLESESNMERTLFMAIEGLKKFVKDKVGLPETMRSKKCKQIMKESSNPILAWMNEDEDNEFVSGKTLEHNFQSYKRWCLENNYKPVGKIKFKQDLITFKGDEVEIISQRGSGMIIINKEEDILMSDFLK